MDKKEKKEIQIEKAEAELVKQREQLQSELAALAAPPLRHGDVRQGHLFLEYYKPSGEEKDGILALDNGLHSGQGRKRMEQLTPTKFNIFDHFADLAAMAVPLKEFARPVGTNNTFGMKINGDCIDYHGGEYCSFVLDEAIKIHCKFGRLIAELKRKAAKT